MIRVLALIVRRDDHTRPQFRAHYEDTHAPLAQSILPPFAHYLRNHVVDGDVPFDVMTEFGYPDTETVVELNRTLSSDAGDPIRADEQSFMTTERNGFFGVEALAEGGRQVLAPGPGPRVALLASAPDRADVAAFREDYLAAFGRWAPAGCAARHWTTRPAGGTPAADLVSFVDASAPLPDWRGIELDGRLCGARIECDASIVASSW